MVDITKIIQDKRKEIKTDKTAVKDAKCPFTGGLKLRGKTFTGIVVSKDTHRTTKVEWSRRLFLKKYERFMISKTKVAAHNPEVIDAQIGDVVIIAECRPLSKTKRFVIIQNLGHSKEYMIKRELIEEDKKSSDEGKQQGNDESEKTDSEE
jgi:small subunit ribosomal protein S17